MKRLFPNIVIICLLLANSCLFGADTVHKVYLVNKSWHTGFIFSTSSIATSQIGALKIFDDYKYVDIGWGDAAFYMTPEFDTENALKAVLVPTKSVIRIEGYNVAIEDIASWNDFTIELQMNDDMFNNFCEFIENSFSRDTNDKYIVSKTLRDGKIRFFRSDLKYHGLNTCNTWAAKALKYSGFDISTFMIITAGQLYNASVEHGRIIKR
jgi:uncharacterized protein (TIGR02117 family)